MTYDPESASDRSRMMREYERETLSEPEYIDEWEKLESEYIRRIYHNTVDDGYYRGVMG